MTRAIAKSVQARAGTRVAVRLIICALLIAPLVIAARAASPASAAQLSGSDDFNRADGGLGSNWSAVSYGALSISGQAVVGTSATAGAIRIGETYAGDQSSQVEVTSTQLSGGQYIGPAVRMQNGGQDMYLGIYYWNNGTQQLRLTRASWQLDAAGQLVQLGSAGGGDAAEGDGGWFDDLVSAGRRRRISVTDCSITGARPESDLRHCQGRQLGRRRGGRAAATYSVGGTVRACRGRWCCRTTAVTI